MTSVIEYDTLPFHSFAPRSLLPRLPLEIGSFGVRGFFFFPLRHSFSALVGTLTESIGHHVQTFIYSCVQGVSKKPCFVRVVAVDALGVPLANPS